MDRATREKIQRREEEIRNLYDGWPWELLSSSTKNRIDKLRDDITDLKFGRCGKRE